MLQQAKSLSSGLEDYIEAIYVDYLNNKQLKAADLARKLNVSRASVSEALAKLVSKKLIKYNSYESITLTSQGITEAKNVYAKHHILKDFFENVLDIPVAEATENACKIEHIVSDNILAKMQKFTGFFMSHKKILKVYMEESENK